MKAGQVEMKGKIEANQQTGQNDKTLSGSESQSQKDGGHNKDYKLMTAKIMAGQEKMGGLDGCLTTECIEHNKLHPVQARIDHQKSDGHPGVCR
jgi:hypothetical protein